MVAYTMESVCILFGAKPNWKESKNLMSKMTFMDELKSFDKDNIPPKVIRALKSYIENPGFLPEEVAKVSAQCAFYGRRRTRVLTTSQFRDRANGKLPTSRSRGSKDTRFGIRINVAFFRFLGMSFVAEARLEFMDDKVSRIGSALPPV